MPELAAAGVLTGFQRAPRAAVLLLIVGLLLVVASVAFVVGSQRRLPRRRSDSPHRVTWCS